MKRLCTINALLFVSLAVNVFLIGFLVTHAPEKRQPPYVRLESQLRGLPEPQKSKVDAILKRYHPQISSQFFAVQAARKELREAIKSPDYSRAKAAALFDTMQAGYRKMGDASQAMILDVNDELTPEQRAKFDPLPAGPAGGK